MDSVDRRSALRRLSVAALTVFGGCVSSGPDRSPGTGPRESSKTDGTTSTRPSRTTDTTRNDGRVLLGESIDYGDGTVTVSGITHQHSAVTVQADTASVVDFSDQLVFVECSVEGTNQPPRSAFRFEYGDRRQDTFFDTGDGDLGYRFYLLDQWYVPGEQSGIIGFQVPSPLPDGRSAVRFEYDGVEGRWPVPDDRLTALRRPAPRFRLEEFVVPDGPVDGSAECTVVVANDGGPGRFRGAVNTGGILHAAEMFTVDVPPNGRASTTVEIDPYGTTGDLRLRLVGSDGIGTERETVTVQ